MVARLSFRPLRNRIDAVGLLLAVALAGGIGGCCAGATTVADGGDVVIDGTNCGESGVVDTLTEELTRAIDQLEQREVVERADLGQGPVVTDRGLGHGGH